MSNNKLVVDNCLVIDNCPNFYRIVDFEFFEDDYVSEKLINIYEKFIFNIDINNEEDLKMIKDLDQVLGKYIDDYMFRRRMQQDIFTVKVKKNCGNIIRAIVESIIKIFDKYVEDTTRNIYISRWI